MISSSPNNEFHSQMVTYAAMRKKKRTEESKNPVTKGTTTRSCPASGPIRSEKLIEELFHRHRQRSPTTTFGPNDNRVRGRENKRYQRNEGL